MLLNKKIKAASLIFLSIIFHLSSKISFAFGNSLFPTSDNYIADPRGFFDKVFGAIISIFFLVAVVYFFWYFVMGGYAMIHTEGDSKKYELARDQITYSLVGLVVVFSVFALLRLVGVLFGIPGLQGPGILTLPWPTL